MIIAGAKSEKRAKRAVLRLVEELKAGGPVILGKPDATITNVVASADLGHRIDLEDAANELERTIYEPDQFPGLIYRLKEPKVVMLIFASGKLRAQADQFLTKEKVEWVADYWIQLDVGNRSCS